MHNPSVPKTIMNYVNSKNYDLVVIGFHGQSGFSEFFLESVSNKVSQLAMSSLNNKINFLQTKY